MNVVLDTNVLISGFLFSGKPEVIIQATLSGKLHAYTSDALLSELARIMKDKFTIRPAEVKETERLLRMACMVTRPKVIPDILTDKPDNQVLAITHEAEIEVIVTGDKKMLELKRYNDTHIMTVDKFLSQYKIDEEA